MIIIVKFHLLRPVLTKEWFVGPGSKSVSSVTKKLTSEAGLAIVINPSVQDKKN